MALIKATLCYDKNNLKLFKEQTILVRKLNNCQHRLGKFINSIPLCISHSIKKNMHRKPCYSFKRMKVIHKANVRPWKKKSAKKVLAERHEASLFIQDFEDPRTSKVYEFSGFNAPNWCSICPITEAGNLLLVREYKQGIDGVFLEFPAGTLEKNEKPIDTAKRELLEETGHTANKIKQIGGARISTRRSPCRFYSFVALGCNSTSKQKLDEKEDIEVIEVSVNEFWELAAQKEIKDTSSLNTALFAVMKGYLPPPTQK